MIDQLLNIFLGTKNERVVKNLKPFIERINSFGDEFKGLRDIELKDRARTLRQRAGNGETLDSVLPEAFALVRETSARTLGLRHFDVQLLGGIVIHKGKIAEMKTGEGKTLAATLPVFLNALSGEGVHVVTFNDYLARRDAEWMGPVYSFLGLTVGFIQNQMPAVNRKKAYSCDVTYGSNKEFGFDYLRDNLVMEDHFRVQRGLNFAVIDEVDSILIDEARTPLIISGSAQENEKTFITADKTISKLEEGKDYEVDYKEKRAVFTEQGVKRIEKMLDINNLYGPGNIILIQTLQQALRANKLFDRDVQYIIRDREVLIVDEFTGRVLPGRKYSDGLHQALEAKERVPISKRKEIKASITYQNFFRLYNKAAGMTGTADSSGVEFKRIYDLDVVVIPTNREVIRNDLPDKFFLTEKDKYISIIEEIEEMIKIERPVLVGTRTIAKSEKLSGMLRSRRIAHNLLNARYDEKEAPIVANAGRRGAVTIATNMAGRGTDIILGGAKSYLKELSSTTPEGDTGNWGAFRSLILNNDLTGAEEILPGLQGKDKKKASGILIRAREWEANNEIVLKAGGLHVIGTEKHDSFRIDNQLRGRSGRQGDPGTSRFFVSLQDDILRLYGSIRIKDLIETIDSGNTQIADSELKSINVASGAENAQKNIEEKNFRVRLNLFDFDSVLNEQRSFIYNERIKILAGREIRSTILDYLNLVIEDKVETVFAAYNFEQAVENLSQWAGGFWSMGTGSMPGLLNLTSIPAVKNFFKEMGISRFISMEKEAGTEVILNSARQIFLRVIDAFWAEHLRNLEDLRDGLWAVRYGTGKNKPIIEYRISASEQFDAMMNSIKVNTLVYIFRMKFEKSGRGK